MKAVHGYFRFMNEMFLDVHKVDIDDSRAVLVRWRKRLCWTFSASSTTICSQSARWSGIVVELGTSFDDDCFLRRPL